MLLNDIPEFSKMTHPGVLLKKANIFAKKEMGQNFLSNPSIAKMIADKAKISLDAHVLEIGPGLGALTMAIAEKAAHIIAVEKDSRIIPLLQKEIEAHGINNVQIMQGDILKISIQQLAQDKKLTVLGNLPYNISSQVLFKLIKEREYIDKAVMMFQKEMADRILASPGSKNYSRLSVLAAYAADISLLTNIGPASFFPAPEVNSTVLEFKFFKRAELNDTQESLLVNVIKAAFSKRRKTLANSMTGGEMKYEKQFILQVLNTAGIDAQRRAETLSVEEFKKIAHAVASLS